MKRKVLVFGSCIGLLIAALFLGPFVFVDASQMTCEQMTEGEVLGYSAMFFPMLLIVLAMNRYRNQFGNGVIAFGKAMQLGMLINVVATFIFYWANVVLYTIINPRLLPDFQVSYKDCMLAQAKSPEEAAEITAQIEMFGDFEPFSYALLMSSSVFIFGILITAVAALVFHFRGKKVAAA